MTKNLFLLLIGFIIGAVAMRSYDSSSESGLSEEVQQQAADTFSASGNSQIEVTQQLDQQSGEVDESEHPAPQQAAAAAGGSAEDLLENSTAPNQVEIAGLNSPEIDVQAENTALPADDRGLPPLLPEEYDFMLEPPEERPLTAAERARIFAAEARDETWAYTMDSLFLFFL